MASKDTESTNQSGGNASTAEELFKSQTVGLVNLQDFKKRRAEALELTEREAQSQPASHDASANQSGASTPLPSDSTPVPVKKKRRKPVTAGKLSFAYNEEDDDPSTTGPNRQSTTQSHNIAQEQSECSEASDTGPRKVRLGPNSGLANAPKVMTKSSMAREAQTRERLRKEFLLMQEAVKDSEIAIPFVFYDGTNIPGGICRVKKGDHVWLFLDKSRKVGARFGVGGNENSKREWARVGVDDLLLVRGEIIIPHHYDFYHFIMNDIQGPNGILFEYSKQPRAGSPRKSATSQEAPQAYDPLLRPKTSMKENGNDLDDFKLEGADQDPTLTKVVDRRWYTRNKHIYPASIWEEYEPSKDFKEGTRRDTEGNAFFFT